MASAGVGVTAGEEQGPAVLAGFHDEEVEAVGGVEVEREVVQSGGEPVVAAAGERGGLFEGQVGRAEVPAAAVPRSGLGGWQAFGGEPGTRGRYGVVRALPTGPVRAVYSCDTSG